MMWGEREWETETEDRSIQCNSTVRMPNKSKHTTNTGTKRKSETQVGDHTRDVVDIVVKVVTAATRDDGGAI